MSNTELVTYIKERTALGISADAVAQELTDVGWPLTDIENALRDLAANVGPTTTMFTVSEEVERLKHSVEHLDGRLGRLEGILAVDASDAPVPSAGQPWEFPPWARWLLWLAFVVVLLAGSFIIKFAFLEDVIGWMPRTIASVAVAILLVSAGAALIKKGYWLLGSVLAGLGLGAGLGISVTAWRVYHLLDGQIFAGALVLIAVIAWLIPYRSAMRWRTARGELYGFILFWLLAGTALSYLDAVRPLVGRLF